jgi:hypothetical protein
VMILTWAQVIIFRKTTSMICKHSPKMNTSMRAPLISTKRSDKSTRNLLRMACWTLKVVKSKEMMTPSFSQWLPAMIDWMVYDKWGLFVMKVIKKFRPNLNLTSVVARMKKKQSRLITTTSISRSALIQSSSSLTLTCICPKHPPLCKS